MLGHIARHGHAAEGSGEVNEDLKKNFIKEVHAAAKSRYAVEVFADMVRTWALAIESPLALGERHAEIEKEYAQIKERYSADEFAHFAQGLAIVFLALERHREDFLGHALEELGAANTRNGQFLTPVCVSRLMAAVNCRNSAGLGYTPGTPIRLSDPSCGSSVLLIEGAEALLSDGVRQADIVIHAGDIDGRACDISYVQLSLLGYAAIVQHMDALAQKRYSQDRFTPGWFLHYMPMRRPFGTRTAEAPATVPAATPDKPQAIEQPKTINVRALVQGEFAF